jgi:hypothetical protein
MALPTLPALWSDVLASLDAFLEWDIVRGVLVLSTGLYLGALAMRLLGRALH